MVKIAICGLPVETWIVQCADLQDRGGKLAAGKLLRRALV
jgi:hypothetical protein